MSKISGHGTAEEHFWLEALWSPHECALDQDYTCPDMTLDVARTYNSTNQPVMTKIKVV